MDERPKGKEIKTNLIKPKLYLRKRVDGTSVVSSLVGNSVVLGFVGMI